jgi:hypothetical protein
MFKINQKSIVFSLGILAILAFGVSIVPEKADAQFGPVSPYSYYSGDANPGSTQPPTTVYVPTYVPTYVPVPEPTPVYVAPAPTSTTVYSNSTNPNPPKAVAKAKATPKPSETNSELTANAVFGSDTFLPSGLLQWILFAILVLLIIILVRKMYGADKRYHAVPLKHD